MAVGIRLGTGNYHVHVKHLNETGKRTIETSQAKQIMVKKWTSYKIANPLPCDECNRRTENIKLIGDNRLVCVECLKGKQP